MINDILETKLAAKGFQTGVTLFRNFLPADCSVGVMTRVPLQGLPIDPNIPNFYKGRYQVVVRHTDPDLGEAMSREVQKILTVEAREFYPATETRGETHLDLFFPETTPISFPRLAGNGYEWSQHFQCNFGMKSL